MKVLSKRKNDNKCLSLFLKIFAVIGCISILYTVFYKSILGDNESWIGFFFNGVNSTDTFMDFFNPIQFSISDNPYDFVDLGAIYPPICYMLYELVACFIPNVNDLGGSGGIRLNEQGMMVYYCITIILLVALALIITSKIKKSRLVKFFVALTIILSFPILYLVERGNILLLVLVLLAYYLFYRNSENAVQRELALIALAFAAAIKIYPAVFGLLLFFDKNKRGKTDWFRIIRCVIYGVLVFVLPFFYYNGFETIEQFISNLSNGVNATSFGGANPQRRMDMITIVRMFTLDKMSDSSVTLISNIFTVIFTALFAAGIFRFSQGWKKALCCAAVCMVVPSFGYTYCIAMVIPAVYMMFSDKSISRFKYLYTIIFAFLLAPIPVISNSLINNAVLVCVIIFGLYIVIAADVICDFFKVDISAEKFLKERRLKMENKKKRDFLTLLKNNIDNIFFIAVILNFAVLIINIVIFKRQDIISTQYLSVDGNHFGDFFESMFFSVKDDLYQYGNIYPPFCYLLLMLMSKLYPDASQYSDPFEMRNTQIGMMLYLIVVALCVITIAFCILKNAKFNSRKKVLALFTILFSLPMFVLIDRGNVLLISLVFSFIFITFYDSENKVYREIALISLAIAAAIKIYPAILGVLLIKRGNIKEIIRTVIYGVLCFSLPFAFFGGMDAVTQFVQNLQEGIGQRQLFEGSVNCQVNLSSVVSTIYRIFNHHPSDAQYAAIESFSKYLSYVLAVQFVLGAFLSKDKWKKVLALSAVILIIPGFSYSYCIASYLPAVMLYITNQKRRKSDLLYLLPMICLIIPYGISLYDFFLSFIEAGTRYTVVCQNISQFFIIVILFVDILIMEINFLRHNGVKVFIKWCWGFVKELLDLFRDIFEKITRKKIDDGKWNAFVQFVKFGFVGLSNTVISTVIYWVMLYFGCNKYLSSITGFIVSVLNSFFWNNTFVFKKDEDEERNPLKALAKTFMSYAATGLVLHNILLWVWTEKVGLNDYIVPIINLVITIPLNFVMNKFWAFKTKKKQDIQKLH